MKTSSAKAKGRRLQNFISEKINLLLGLDSRPAIMGESGMDIKLSREDRERFPFAIEAKNRERFSIWHALEQAAANAENGLTPLLVFKRNRSKTYVAMEFDDFLELLK